VSRYRLQYAREAQAALRAMDPELRRRFDAAMANLARDPYGYGSTAVKEQDYRQAAVTDTVVVYYVSANVLLVTVVRIVH
jgi:mRNA-degrading endonuclease RelE of RelBE toxin-antitoxin system